MLEHLEESGPQISELDLRRFEREANLELPSDYRAFLLKHNGGRPIPADFMLTLDDAQVHWRVHFFFGLNDPVESCCSDSKRAHLSGGVGPGTLHMSE